MTTLGVEVEWLSWNSLAMRTAAKTSLNLEDTPKIARRDPFFYGIYARTSSVRIFAMPKLDPNLYNPKGYKPDLILDLAVSGQACLPVGK